MMVLNMNFFAGVKVNRIKFSGNWGEGGRCGLFVFFGRISIQYNIISDFD